LTARDFVSIPADKAELLPVEGDGGLTLNLYRLPAARADLPVVIFGHACGFAAGAYLPLFERLNGVAEIFAFDARGHGGSDAPVADLSIYAPDYFARDLARLGAAVAAHAPARAIYYVGHSLGAATLLRLGSAWPELFATVPWRGFLLFEPPIFPSVDIAEHDEAAAKDRHLIARTQRRRPLWPSPEALAEAVTGRGLFRQVSQEFLLAYARATLRPSHDAYRLACPPEVEAHTFAAFGTDATFRLLTKFPRQLPLHLVAGDPDGGTDRNWTTAVAPHIVERLGLGINPDAARRFTQLRGHGHLMVQESPQLSENFIRALVTNG
jgi:pimeloyl-ACP methyl ester carboxylesterase